jgi:hypothetical protein
MGTRHLHRLYTFPSFAVHLHFPHSWRFFCTVLCSLKALATRITKNSTLHCQRKATVRLLPKTDPQKMWHPRTSLAACLAAGIQKQKKLLGPHERIGRVEKKALMACAQTILLYCTGLFI